MSFRRNHSSTRHHRSPPAQICLHQSHQHHPHYHHHHDRHHPPAQICLDQRAPGYRAISEGRHGEPGIRPHVLQQGLTAMAGTQGLYPQIDHF